MKYKLFADKDSYINSYYSLRNYGAEQVLEVSANTLGSTREKQRILIQFNLNSLSSVKNNNLFPQSLSSITSAKLVMFNSDHSNQYLEDCTIEIFPLTASWFANRGLGKSFADNTYVNWNTRQRNTNWSLSGGDYLTSSSLSASFYSELGNENLISDITPIVNAWDLGTIDNNGLILKLSDIDEATTSNLGYKKFYSENTHTNYIPYILFDYAWEEYDDRHEVWTDVQQRIYSSVDRNYNTSTSSVNSVVVNLFGINEEVLTSNLQFGYSKWVLTSITSYNSSYSATTNSTTGMFYSATATSLSAYIQNTEYLLSSLTASWDSQLKKYYVDFTINSLSSSFDKYIDRWIYNGLTSENEFFVRPVEFKDFEYDIFVKSLNKEVYNTNSFDKVRLFIQDRTSFNLTPTVSLNRDFYTTVLKEVHYEIIDVNNNIWGNKTLCSRSKEYNYFYLLCDQYPVGLYKIKVYYSINGMEYNIIAGKFEIK